MNAIDAKTSNHKLTMTALEAAEQCITDFIDVYKRDCSMLVLDEAVKSLRSDALAKVVAALKVNRAADAPTGLGDNE